ncbi:hypothetical protein [Mycobacterium sp.]|uniref:hypothetical protein n=1 Tax=Mycobacterium sp. TaxID=1785 RepID=UPI003F9C5513
MWAKKAKTQVVAGADAVQAGFGRGAGLVDCVGAQVGQFDGFDVTRYRDMERTLGFEGHIAWAEAMP